MEIRQIVLAKDKVGEDNRYYAKSGK